MPLPGASWSAGVVQAVERGVVQGSACLWIYTRFTNETRVADRDSAVDGGLLCK